METGIARLETPRSSKAAKIRPVLMQHIDKPKRFFDGERHATRFQLSSHFKRTANFRRDRSVGDNLPDGRSDHSRLHAR